MKFNDFNSMKIKFSGKVVSKEKQRRISGGLRNLRKNPGEEEDCLPQSFPYGRGGAYFGCD